MSIEGQGHFFTIYFPGFVCFVLYLAKISGERLQDHWSSGIVVVLLIPSLLGVPDSEMEGIYKELEITPDQSVVWPPSNRVGSLQDKHLPLLMWNLVEAFRYFVSFL